MEFLSLRLDISWGRRRRVTDKIIPLPKVKARVSDSVAIWGSLNRMFGLFELTGGEENEREIETDGRDEWREILYKLV